MAYKSTEKQQRNKNQNARVAPLDLQSARIHSNVRHYSRRGQRRPLTNCSQHRRQKGTPVGHSVKIALKGKGKERGGRERFRRWVDDGSRSPCHRGCSDDRVSNTGLTSFRPVIPGGGTPTLLTPQRVLYRLRQLSNCASSATAITARTST